MDREAALTGIYLQCNTCGAVKDRTDLTATGTYHWSHAPALEQEVAFLGGTNGSGDDRVDLCPTCSGVSAADQARLVEEMRNMPLRQGYYEKPGKDEIFVTARSGKP